MSRICLCRMSETGWMQLLQQTSWNTKRISTFTWSSVHRVVDLKTMDVSASGGRNDAWHRSVTWRASRWQLPKVGGVLNSNQTTCVLQLTRLRTASCIETPISVNWFVGYGYAVRPQVTCYLHELLIPLFGQVSTRVSNHWMVIVIVIIITVLLVKALMTMTTTTMIIIIVAIINYINHAGIVFLH